MSLNFTPEFFQKMVDAENDQELHRFRSFYGQNVAGQSPNDKIFDALASFRILNSKKLNRMKAAVLTEQAEECYKDKWMSEAFSNAEQIAICKQEVHDKHFGALDKEEQNLRESSYFRYQDCERAAGNNIIEFVQCVRDYGKDI